MKTLDTIYIDKMLTLRKALVEEELCHSTLFDYSFKVDGSSIDLLHNYAVIRLLEYEHKINSYN